MEGRKFFVILMVASATSFAQAADIATVNGQTLTDKDLRMALGSMNQGMRESVLKDPNTRRQILSGLIDQEVLVNEAVKEKMDQDQEYKDALALFRKQYLSSRALQKNLGPKISESAAKKFYDQNKSKYSTDQVHAQHILVADEEKAREVLKAAQAKDADFQDLAEKYSRDPSAKNNRGDLGSFGRNAPFDPGFLEAAFSGNKGEIVGPVKTAFGYHLIKVVDKKFGKPLSFDDVKVQAERDLGAALKSAYVGKLRKEAKIQINDNALDKI